VGVPPDHADHCLPPIQHSRSAKSILRNTMPGDNFFEEVHQLSKRYMCWHAAMVVLCVAFCCAGPAFTISGRPAEPAQARDRSPGPGEYQQQQYRPTGPAFTIPKRCVGRSHHACASRYASVNGFMTCLAQQPTHTPCHLLFDPPSQMLTSNACIHVHNHPDVAACTACWYRRDPAPRGKASSPAPGDYATDLSWRPAGPAFSFGSAPPASSALEEYGLMPGGGGVSSPCMFA